MTYTCEDYRAEMILAGLKKRVADPSLDKAEKQRLEHEIRRLEESMGLD